MIPTWEHAHMCSWHASRCQGYVWRLFGPLADCWINEAVRSPRFDTIGIDGGHQFSSCRR